MRSALEELGLQSVELPHCPLALCPQLLKPLFGTAGTLGRELNRAVELGSRVVRALTSAQEPWWRSADVAGADVGLN